MSDSLSTPSFNDPSLDTQGTDHSELTNPILVLNCGSSSIKYALISEDESTRITGLAENLGLDTARIIHTQLNGEKLEIAIPGKSQSY